jgi:hypothetical protein
VEHACADAAVWGWLVSVTPRGSRDVEALLVSETGARRRVRAHAADVLADRTARAAWRVIARSGDLDVVVPDVHAMARARRRHRGDECACARCGALRPAADFGDGDSLCGVCRLESVERLLHHRVAG